MLKSLYSVGFYNDLHEYGSTGWLGASRNSHAWAGGYSTLVSRAYLNLRDPLMFALRDSKGRRVSKMVQGATKYTAWSPWVKVWLTRHLP